MRIYYECMPCFARQAVKALKNIDESFHEEVMRESMRALADIDFTLSPPEMAEVLFGIIEKHTGSVDHYEQIKRASNEYVLGMIDDLRKIIEAADDRFEAALRLAVAGNIIDFGANHGFTDDMIHEEIEKAERAPIDPYGISALREEIEKAGKILYLGDNAGEIVFDRLFIEELPREKIIFAVRGSHIINDALMEDAESAGITKLVKVVSNGAALPGTVLRVCSDEFRKIFEEADLIISKGQGNFETLSDVEKNIFFLLKVKCDVVARHLGVSTGAFIVRRRTKRL